MAVLLHHFLCLWEHANFPDPAAAPTHISTSTLGCELFFHFYFSITSSKFFLLLDHYLIILPYELVCFLLSPLNFFPRCPKVHMIYNPLFEMQGVYLPFSFTFLFI